jgi:hypothetical protein
MVRKKTIIRFTGWAKCVLCKIYDVTMLFKPAPNKHYKDSYQFSCKIQVDGFDACWVHP